MPEPKEYRIILSDYSEAHSLSRLIGAAPGFVGFGDMALLERIRVENARVIFEEADRAHPAIIKALFSQNASGDYVLNPVIDLADGSTLTLDPQAVTIETYAQGVERRNQAFLGRSNFHKGLPQPIAATTPLKLPRPR